MPVDNPLRRKLEAGELSLAVGVRAFRSVEIAPIMKTAGYDALLIDLEHGACTLDSVATISIAALALGIAPIVRVCGNDIDTAARCLDLGALGIIMPQVHDADEARSFTRALRFPPHGYRSFGSGSPMFGFANVSASEAMPMVDRAVLLFALIESAKAVENVEEIAAVPGLDGLIVGANDLSIDLGIPGRYEDPRLAAAAERTLLACRRNGKFAGMGGFQDVGLMKKYIGLGARLIISGHHTSILMAAAQARVSSLRALTAD